MKTPQISSISSSYPFSVKSATIQEVSSPSSDPDPPRMFQSLTWGIRSKLSLPSSPFFRSPLFVTECWNFRAIYQHVIYSFS